MYTKIHKLRKGGNVLMTIKVLGNHQKLIIRSFYKNITSSQGTKSIY